MLLQEGIERIRDKKFLMRTMDEYTSPQSKHNTRLRHFELVADRMSSVRRRKAEEMLARFNQFKSEKSQEETRLSNFFKSRQTTKKRVGRPLTVSNFYSQANTPTLEHKPSATETFLTAKNPKPEDNRSERLRSLQQQNEQRSLSKFISKMQRVESRIVYNEVSK